MLDIIGNKIIKVLKNKQPFNHHNGNNCWEEFCYSYQGDSHDLRLWEDFIIAQIEIEIDSSSKLERFEAWLNTDEGKDYLYGKFNGVFDLKYLNLKELSKEVGGNSDDIVIALFNSIKSKAADYKLRE